MNFFPSHRLPRIPLDHIDWKLRAAFGRHELTRLWHDLWWSGVAAGRIEGVVGTTLVVMGVAVVMLVVVAALRKGR